MNNVQICSNIVNKETFRNVQRAALKAISEYLECSFGPYGSNTLIYEGEQGLPRFSKDGHTILTRLQFAGEIEKAVLADIKEETRTQALKVGDSTTSITILSHLIFEALSEFEKDTEVTPSDIVDIFRKVVGIISLEIDKRSKPFDPTVAYDISYISTNANEEYSTLISDIYTKFGNDVFIDVKASTSGSTYYEELNGMNLEYGYMDVSFINNHQTGTCELKEPNIYFFRDPIDTLEMGQIVDRIVHKNLYAPMQDKSGKTPVIPTLIIAPRFSKDYSRYIDSLLNTLSKQAVNDFPLCIVTGTTSVDEEELDEVRYFCGCEWIQKYIDPSIQENHIKNRKAIDLNSDATFKASIRVYEGKAKQVVVSKNHTIFIDPKNRYNADGTDSDHFKNRVKWLEESIKDEESTTHDILDIYKLKKRLNSIKGNMVEIFVGGITSADRDQERDLVEDAVLNCRSAAKNGVGLGANFEGMIASKNVFNRLSDIINDKRNGKEAYLGLKDDPMATPIGELFNKFKFERELSAIYKISEIIYNAYESIINKLYKGFLEKDDINSMMAEAEFTDKIYDLRSREFNGNVLTSIDTDKWVLFTISKIITIMVTSNQFAMTTLNMNSY